MIAEVAHHRGNDATIFECLALQLERGKKMVEHVILLELRVEERQKMPEANMGKNIQL